MQMNLRTLEKWKPHIESKRSHLLKTPYINWKTWVSCLHSAKPQFLVQWGKRVIRSAIVSPGRYRYYSLVRTMLAVFSQKDLVDPAACNFLPHEPSGDGPFIQTPGGPRVERQRPPCLHSRPSRQECWKCRRQKSRKRRKESFFRVQCIFPILLVSQSMGMGRWPGMCTERPWGEWKGAKV